MVRMSRASLPQLEGGFYLMEGGLETTLIFHEGIDLPDFASFVMLRRPGGPELLRKHARKFLNLARRFEAGLILDSATWRASSDWGDRLGFSRKELAEVNRASIAFLEESRAEFADSGLPAVLSGTLGPRGDGYAPDRLMTADEAEAYHRDQIETFADTAVDLVTAWTINYADEAIGIVRAARAADLPVAISFTLETDGQLATGQSLGAAIAEVDAATNSYASYYLLNCVHPIHFEPVLASGGPWLDRLRGLRSNSSKKSHAELNESTELDPGDPADLGARHVRLKELLPNLNVLGGCCGTDDRHVEQIAAACAPLFRSAR